jgi:lipopolysaccharide transport system permease protein
VNPHAIPSLSPVTAAATLWRNRHLIWQLAAREVWGRYRGSVMGLFWSFLHPVLMLAVYTFVFSVVFRARWGITEEETRTQFAVVLFSGLIVHGLFSEVLNRAPGLILGHANFVKRIVFPLEILPAVVLGAAVFHTLVSIIVLAFAFLLFAGIPPWTMVLAPVVLAPLALLSLGCAWFLASLGVYLRDIGQAVGIITVALLFLSPIFYPITAMPEAYRPILSLNPLTFIIEQARAVLIWGNMPDWGGLAIYTGIAACIAALGYAWFQATRRGFADVL